MGLSCSKPQRKTQTEPAGPARWDSDSDFSLDPDFFEPEAKESPSLLRRAPEDSLSSTARPESDLDKETQTEEDNLDKETQTEEDNLDKGTQTEEENLESRTATRSVDVQIQPEPVREAPWSPTELYTWLKEAPDVFRKPVSFYKHLRVFCLAFQPRPAQLRSLLEAAYDFRWEKVKRHFSIPGADADDRWDAVPMATWLEGTCRASISTAAMESPDFHQATDCCQGRKEAVSDFLSRFQDMWDSAWGDTYSHMAPWHLKNALQPHVEKLLELKVISWKRLSLAELTGCLQFMDSRGWLDSKRKTLDVIREHKASLELPALPALPPYRWGRRRGRCYRCHRFGHWVRECRAGTRKPPQQLALGWEEMD